MSRLRAWQQPFLGLNEFPTGLTDFEIGYCFCFDDRERIAIASRRGDYHRLAAAIHLGFLKLTGRTLDAVDRIPLRVLFHLSEALELPPLELATLRSLYKRQRTLFEHQCWAMDVLDIRPFTERRQRVLVRLFRREAQKAISIPTLVLSMKRWLHEKKILIPAEGRLRKLAGRIAREAEKAFYQLVESRIATQTRELWFTELWSRRGDYKSALEWLQHVPKRRGQITIEEAHTKLTFLRELGVHHYPLKGICLERQRRYAQQLRRRRPAQLRTLSEPRRTLEIVCFLQITLLQIVDLIVSLADLRITDLRRDALGRVRAKEQQTLYELRNTLARMQQMAEDKSLSDATFRHRFLELVPCHIVEHPSRAAAHRSELSNDNRRLRPLLRLLLTLQFEGHPESPIVAALSQLNSLYCQRMKELPVDEEFTVPQRWSTLVHSNDRKAALHAFEAATLQSIQKSIRNGSLWVSDSFSYRSRDQTLISAGDWQTEGHTYYRRLGLPRTANDYLKPLLPALQAGLDAAAEAVRQKAIYLDKEGVHLPSIVAEPEDRLVVKARKRIFDQIGHVQLPKIIVDVDEETRFSWTLLGRAPSSERELLTLYGALLAHGTEMNAARVSLMIPDITEASIAEAMHFLERDTALREANNLVVEYLRRHPLVRFWGTGQTASADAMTLDVSRLLWNARIDPRRRTHGVGIYTHLSDQWSLIYDQPVILGQRQAGAAIEGVVRQAAAELIERLAVDTHGYTDFGMALAKLLGFDLCPRLKDMRDRKLHVPRQLTVPTELASIVKRDVMLDHLDAGWDEFVRLAVSVDTGKLSAVLALQRFGAATRGDPLHQAGTALGQLLRSLFLCDYLTKPTFRRELSRLLYYGESLHTLQRAIHYGSINAARGRRHEELIAISGSLTLLTNLVMAWNTHQMQHVLDKWKQTDEKYVQPEFLHHISPIHFRHINFRGEFHFPITPAAHRLIRSRTKAVL